MTPDNDDKGHGAALKLVSKHVCPECGVPVERTRVAGTPQVFCSKAHKTAHANRCAQRGKALVKMAMGWRVDRGTGAVAKFCFQEMTAMLDRWAAEDRDARRMRGPDYAALVCDFDPRNPNWSRTYADREQMTVKRRKAARVLTCSKGYQGCDGTVTGEAEGWILNPPTCPNCREDNVIERRAAE